MIGCVRLKSLLVQAVRQKPTAASDACIGQTLPQVLRNRIDPALVSGMFQSWAATFRPGAPARVAIDGKTLRGSHDHGNGRAALHPVPAFATRGSWCWTGRRSRTGPARRPRSRSCGRGCCAGARSKARSSRSMPSPATPTPRRQSATRGRTVSWRERPISPA